MTEQRKWVAEKLRKAIVQNAEQHPSFGASAEEWENFLHSAVLQLLSENAGLSSRISHLDTVIAKLTTAINSH